ncbi:MAG: hypothetical protein K0Q49_1423 [Haloplasmataceae bacterium]|jgi:uncharacterized protein YqeY|nr:hypothetical protein [Haloplasmataceae bacterium]
MLLEKLAEDLKTAMKSKDKDRLDTIRALKTALMNEKIKLMVDNLTEEQENGILAREVKQRKDSIVDFKKASRQDLVENEERQLKILDTYLPKQLDREEIIAIINKTCQEIGASSIKDMGKVMSTISPLVKGKADMASVNGLVKEILSK